MDHRRTGLRWCDFYPFARLFTFYFASRRMGAPGAARIPDRRFGNVPDGIIDGDFDTYTFTQRPDERPG